MNLSGYLAGLVLVVFLAIACLTAILVYFSPQTSSAGVFSLFYLALLISAAGIFTLIGFFIRQISRKKRIPLSQGQVVRNLEVSFRQGFLLSIILVSVLILQSQRLLYWWDLAALVGLVGLAEWWLMKRQ
ncbi:MAG: hypothetical protein CO003_00110 [Candidatus Portnoybacteria bacterium CG_4_8_14_3_um_filter_44_15]|uniref:DUF2178 domain-containing protein n=4 Tax=Candidatus Portnoyibacteriota TaxID=1817913 RepID=A0A2M7YMI8_9BACT|nr:MAG: hypothetical protein COX45_00585 [Candidatus Portnoybacteria bacterium CG23_combo_of_CG06-09_8_20_14_all_44_36]PIW74902.1 MAG: hypothetical protein CO003_00110 [Candidatus Portnoybacteria bacterium CG_4_8_14_3_um_filter_44_15]PIZ70084.1 MAG: hypothetical protein COY10_00310 [Candidatus Portnoybacteria bacterium CG_4_10_14_0_2_um_filter_43_36]PJA64122.1 MAG: hypothetical protein CO160_00295 [Candidatus Portnoybacteria bacterium CG_4_9_14_3_um_filter_43_11]PJE59389.1 MAG: hypothetical pro